MIYDAVLCVAPQHNKIAITAFYSLASNANARYIYIITAINNFQSFQGLQNCGVPIILIDENSLIPSVDLQSIQAFLTKKGADPQRAGWYLQQFLKMAVCYVPAVADHYLVWDADTVLLRPIRFFNEEDRILVNPSSEYHRPYFDTYSTILGKERKADYSFISEYFMVKKDFMQELIRAIEDHMPIDQPWVWKIMNAIDTTQLSGAGFSEYETYGNFILSTHSESFVTYPLTSWRYGSDKFGGSPNKFDLFRLSLKYSYATFEVWSQGRNRKVAKEKVISFIYYLCLYPIKYFYEKLRNRRSRNGLVKCLS